MFIKMKGMEKQVQWNAVIFWKSADYRSIRFEIHPILYEGMRHATEYCTADNNFLRW